MGRPVVAEDAPSFFSMDDHLDEIGYGWKCFRAASLIVFSLIIGDPLVMKNPMFP